MFEAVRSLAAAGEYLDEIPGGEPSLARSDDLYVRLAAGRLRRLYRRGSPDYLQARRDGLIEPLPALVTAPAAAVDEAETIIGFGLPPLLRRLYLEVGNGGPRMLLDRRGVADTVRLWASHSLVSTTSP